MATTSTHNGVFKDASGRVIGQPRVINPSTNLPIGAITLSTNGSNPFKLTANLYVGDSIVRQTNNDYAVLKVDDAGKVYSEKMTTNAAMPYVATVSYDTHSWSCPPCGLNGCSTCYHTDSYEGIYNYSSWTHTDGQLAATTEVVVPYNFINSANLTLGGNDDGVVYSGDMISVASANVTVGTRDNRATVDTYATQVDDAEVRLIAYVSDESADQQIARYGTGGTGMAGEQTPDEMNNLENKDAKNVNICNSGWLHKKQCMEANEYINSNDTAKLNPEGNLDGVTHGTNGSETLGFDIDYNVYDASAGDYMCFVIAVYPWRSGAVGNDAADKVTDPAGDHKWLITAPKCRQIAKNRRCRC